MMPGKDQRKSLFACTNLALDTLPTTAFAHVRGKSKDLDKLVPGAKPCAILKMQIMTWSLLGTFDWS